MPSWSDAPFDRPIIFAQQYKLWNFCLCCFIHPALILYLSVPDIFLSTWILDTLGLWPCFTPSLTTDKILILYVTFCNWSVRQYSCQYMTKFVNLLCQYVTVSLSVAVCSFSQLYIYVYVVVTAAAAAAGAEADRCMWAHCASEVLWEARSYNVQESLQQVAALWPQVHCCLFCSVHSISVRSWFPVRYDPRVDTWLMYRATCRTKVSVTDLYVQTVVMPLSLFYSHSVKSDFWSFFAVHIVII